MPIITTTSSQTAPAMYGQLESEKIVDERKFVHELVRELNNIGITERQRWFLIHAIALELENVHDMQELCQFIKDLKGDQVFLTGKVVSFESASK